MRTKLKTFYHYSKCELRSNDGNLINCESHATKEGHSTAFSELGILKNKHGDVS